MTTLATNVGPSGVAVPGEDLLGVAFDPVTQTIYFSSRSGNVYKRTADGAAPTPILPSLGSPVLGLELAPAGFGSFGGDLIATTQDGKVFAIDPLAPNPAAQITLTGPGAVAHLSDLVFDAAGKLYVIDNHETSSRILRVAPDGTFVDLLAPQLGLADGIEIDEGGHRLLVTSQTPGGRLLAVNLDAIPAAVTPLANISIDDSFFPTGVVYDRLGTAVFRQGNNSTSLRAVSVAP